MKHPCLTLFAGLLLWASAIQSPAAHVWVEGESGRGENISRNGWYLSVRTGDLSGGDWLATYGGSRPATASYRIDVPEAGSYTFWVRANPVAATMSVRINGEGDWLPVPITKKSFESMNIASDGKPDMRFIAWTKVGAIRLGKGAAALEFRMSSANGNHGAIDCFCLTTDSA